MKKSLICNSCGKRFRVGEEMAGRQPTCPSCGTGDVTYAKHGYGGGLVTAKTKFVIGEGGKAESVKRVKFGLPNIDDLMEGL